MQPLSNNKQSSFLASVDRGCDVVPVLSIVTNVVDIVAKCVLALASSSSRAKNKIQRVAYLKHLNDKKFKHCFIAAIPLAGNYLAYRYHYGKKDSNDVLPINNNIGGLRNQPVSRLTGIMNENQDCYFNVAVQCIMNSPSLLAAAKEMGKKNEHYKNLVEDYENCQLEGRSMEVGKGTPYRRFREDMHSRYNKFPPAQSGASQRVFECFWADMKKYLPKNSQYLEENFFDVYAGDPDVEFNDGFIHQWSDDEGLMFTIKKPPTTFNFNVNDGANTRQDTLKFTFDKKLFENGETPTYECTFIALQMGDISAGHYYCLIKQKGYWYSVSDDVVESKPLNDNQVLEFLQKSGRGGEAQFYSFTRVEDQPELM